MSARAVSRLAWPLWLVLAVVWPLSRIALPLTPEQWQLDPPVWHLGFLAYGAIGALVVTRKPGNRVGWLQAWIWAPSMGSLVRPVLLTDTGLPGLARALPTAAFGVLAVLYDIDRAINRTVVFTALSVVLGLSYFALVSAMRVVSATIKSFSGRLRDEVDLETIQTELLTVVGATMQPAATSLWLRDMST